MSNNKTLDINSLMQGYQGYKCSLHFKYLRLADPHDTSNGRAEFICTPDYTVLDVRGKKTTCIEYAPSFATYLFPQQEEVVKKHITKLFEKEGAHILRQDEVHHDSLPSKLSFLTLYGNKTEFFNVIDAIHDKHSPARNLVVDHVRSVYRPSHPAHL